MVSVTYPCYKLKKDVRGQWYWVFYARNAEEISKSSESYVAKSDCQRSIELNKGSGQSPVYEV